MARRCFVDVAGGPGRTVVVAGSGRSGTTWLGELLTRGTATRYLFEPLHPDRGPFPGEFPRSYARPGAAFDQEDAWARIVSGKVRDPWTDQYGHAFLPRRRVVKEVWANLQLGWLADRYPDLTLVLLLRHPYSVARSQLSSRWDWYLDPRLYLQQELLMQDHLAPFEEWLAAARTPWDLAVATWCVENLVPLRQLARAEAHVVFYEHLRLDPEGELRALFAALGRRWDPRVLHGVRRPSALAHPGAWAMLADSLDERWKEADPRLLARTVEILQVFGLATLYGEGPLPLRPLGASVLAPTPARRA
jgi:hypothetical protein